MRALTVLLLALLPTLALALDQGQPAQTPPVNVQGVFTPGQGGPAGGAIWASGNWTGDGPNPSHAFSQVYVQEQANSTYGATGQMGAPVTGTFNAHAVDMQFGGGATGFGNRTAISGYLHTIGAGAPGSAAQFYTGVFGLAQIGHSLGGSPGSPKGDVYGMGAVVQLLPGATNINGISGFELDFSVLSGATTDQKQALSLVSVNNDAVQGRLSDSFMVMARDSSSRVGSRIGIQFGRYDAQWPMDPDGTMIGTQKPASGMAVARHGVDLSMVAISGNAWSSPGYQVKGSGIVRYIPRTAPVSPEEGDTYYDIATRKMRTYDGLAWRDHW